MSGAHTGLLILVPFLLLLPASAYAAYTTEVIADNLQVPWSVDFAPDGRIFFSERGGSIHVIEDGHVSEPLVRLDVGSVEGGMLGIALDPDFDDNGHVYAYYTYTDWLSSYNRVVRFTENDGVLGDQTILIDDIPGSVIHNGGRIKFADDGTIYVTTGDAGNAALAQRPDSLAGKILRINPDGTVPPDNPVEGSPVYSLGHRNPQGLDWDYDTDTLVISEHGPSGERGFAHDEINAVYPGANYGWPDVVGDETKEGMQSPLLHSGTETWAPSGAVFYNHDIIEEFAGRFLVATLAGNRMLSVSMDVGQGTVHDVQVHFGEWGRLRDVAVDNDGNIYVLTSNRDGRGSPDDTDDKIIKISPAKIWAPPLKQVQNGTMPHDVKCNIGLVLAIKEHTSMPACIKTESLEKLVDRGWARMPYGT